MKVRRTRRRGDGETRGRGEVGTRGRGETGTGKRGVLVWLTITLVLVVLASVACALQASHQGVPPEVESVVTTVGEDAEEGRYEKIYNEADEQWRQDSTLEQTTAVFSTVKNKLGKI